jgi:hypothetical protein
LGPVFFNFWDPKKKPFLGPKRDSFWDPKVLQPWSTIAALCFSEKPKNFKILFF